VCKIRGQQYYYNIELKMTVQELSKYEPKLL
jgi:hypothetical protein